MNCGCPLLPPPVDSSTNRQNCNPHEPPAQPCCSTQCRLCHTCCTLQRLHLILQCPVACPGLATHTLAGLCVLCLLSSDSTTSGKLQHSVTPHDPQTTCPAKPQYPVQAPPYLLHTAGAAFELAVAHGMPMAGHSPIGRALCAVVAEWCLHNTCNTLAFSKTTIPTNHLPSPAAAPSAGSTTPAAHCRGCK